jgi:hypothetical protein
VSFTIAQASRLYAVPLTDYGPARGDGLLVSSGCGMMMSVMDEVPALRWCVDLDAVHDKRSRIGDFLLVAETLASPIGVCGWFSISDPEPLRAAVRAMTRRPIVYCGNIKLGAGCEVFSLGAFSWALRVRAEQDLRRRSRAGL